MSATHYFQRYSQRENVVTNNVLMLFQRICEQSPRKFETVLSSLAERSTTGGPDLNVGPRFMQQVRGPERVADGLISQLGFDLLIETKLGSGFDQAQAIGHLAQLKHSANPILLLLGKEPSPTDPALQSVLDAAAAAERGVRVIVCAFKDVIEECRAVFAQYDEKFIDLIDDFEDFCVQSGLMPNDEYTLFVPPCGLSFDENLRWKLYYCPATRSRRVGRWLGVYKEKRVHAIGRIDRVLDVSSDDNGEILTPGASSEERARILGAIEDAKQRDWDLLDEPHTFYVCSNMVETSFDKDSSGGIAGHRYFDLSRLRHDKSAALTSETIAQGLRNQKWKDWGQN